MPTPTVVGASHDDPRTARLRRALHAARLAEWAARTSRIGSGGVIGGWVLLAAEPSAATQLARGRQVVAVSGTNGKTTTTAYVASALAELGEVDTNQDGANTRPGLVRALAGTAPRVVLETDEGWLPWLVADVRPDVAVLLNLSRDQLHRHHEVASLARSWAETARGLPHVVANASDPAVVVAALGAEHRTWVAVPRSWRHDDLVCPACGGELHHRADEWWCDCGLRSPRPDWWLDGAVLRGADGIAVPLQLALPGTANLANAAMAVAAAAVLGVDPAAAAQRLRGIDDVAGRYAVVEHAGHRVRLLLAKNPASWAEALQMLDDDGHPVVLAFNSEGVDGRDPSWLYDVPFELLAGRVVVATGRRSTDMLVRLRTAGLTSAQQAPDVRRAVAGLPEGEITVIANYTAFQDARQALHP